MDQQAKSSLVSGLACVFSHLSSCKDDKVIDSLRDDLSKQADDDASHLVTPHRHVKEDLREDTTEPRFLKLL